MPFVTLKEKFQVTLPAALRRQLGIKVGDVLEVELNGSRLVLTPQAVLNRNILEPLKVLPNKLDTDRASLGVAEHVFKNIRSLLMRKK